MFPATQLGGGARICITHLYKALAILNCSSTCLHITQLTLDIGLRAAKRKMDDSPFAKLPPELRDHIYDAALRFSDDVVLSELRREGGSGLYSESDTKQVSLGILLLCQQITKEATKRLYAINTFAVVQNKVDASCDEVLSKFIHSIGKTNAESLQSIRVSYTLTQGTIFNGQFRSHLRRLRDVVRRIPHCLMKVDLSFFDIYKTILLQVPLNLQILNTLGTGDAWIGKFETSVTASEEESPEVQESIVFLKRHLRDCRKDLEKNEVATEPHRASYPW